MGGGKTINYKEKGCNDRCIGCGHNIPYKDRRFCKLKMIDLTGTKVKFEKGYIVN